MLGIVFGTFCLFALVKVARGRHYWHSHRWGGGRHRYGGRGRWFLRALFRRLNTGPGQEKVVLGEIDNLRETTRGLRTELKATRSDIAVMMRDDVFDRSKLDSLFRKQDELLGRLRDAAAVSLEKVHAVLDNNQKADLANMVERGWAW